jgi:hypothetical protein
LELQEICHSLLKVTVFAESIGGLCQTKLFDWENKPQNCEEHKDW